MEKMTWISVKSFLPDIEAGITSSDRVLVTDGKNVGTAIFYKGQNPKLGRYENFGWELSESWWQSITLGEVNLNKVTYWAPISDLVATIPKSE